MENEQIESPNSRQQRFSFDEEDVNFESDSEESFSIGTGDENKGKAESLNMSYQQKHLNDYFKPTSSISLVESSESEEEILLRESSENPRRFSSRVKGSLEEEEDGSSNNKGENRRSPQTTQFAQKPPPIDHRLSDSDSESENLARLDVKPIPGQYDPKMFEYLNVKQEIKELFQYVTMYSPQHLNLDCKLLPFLPDYIPTIGDVDAFLKSVPPLKFPDTDEIYNNEEFELGVKVIDEPSIYQSEKALLSLQLRAESLNVHHYGDVIIRKVDNVEKNGKVIDKWIKDLGDLQKTKTASYVEYSCPMPNLDDLMQEWPSEVENFLKIKGFPCYKLKCPLESYVDIVCSIFDIPLNENRIESLHMLFCLYAAIKASQVYKNSSEGGNNIIEGERNKMKEENQAKSEILVIN